MLQGNNQFKDFWDKNRIFVPFFLMVLFCLSIICCGLYESAFALVTAITSIDLVFLYLYLESCNDENN
nr:MAG TPA: Tetratricopeptide repeat-like domain [Bacteriophage sp.]